MTDYGARYTDRREAVLDWRLMRIYAEAQKDLRNKLNAYFSKSDDSVKKKQKELEDGKISDEDYKSWLAMHIFRGEQWKAAVDGATDVLLQSNKVAMSIVREEQINVFAENCNIHAYEAEKKTGVSFDIYDAASVGRLVRDNPELLPRKTVNGRKDKAWNQGIISRTITQGIIQGESIPAIAKRMANDTSSKNMRAMFRYARTAMTGAQNAGRIENMHHAQGMGIIVRKQWLATLNRTTRDAHRLLDGQEQDVDKPFKSELGNIMYPGDPSASPGNIYNCRCTLITIYPEYEKATYKGSRFEQQSGKEISDMSYREWISMKEKERYGKTVTRPESDVTDKYVRNAKPKNGKVTFDANFKFTEEPNEIKIARWLRDTFGGDVHVKKAQNESEGIKYCDYIWRSKNWELKSPGKMKSPDRILETALQQIQSNPGGIILDYQSDDFDLERVVNGARRRMENCGFNVDLMILHKGLLMCVKRYKK